MLVVRADKEALGSGSARGASFELSGEQVADVTHVEVIRSMRHGRLRLPNVPLGCGDESLKLTFLIAGAFDQELRVVSKGVKLFGSKPERHSSHSSAGAIRSRSSEA